MSDTTKASQLSVVPPELHKLQKGDRLKIYVTALDPQAASQFAMPLGEPIISTSSITRAEGIGYLVDNSGTIVFPQLGHIYVEGLTSDSVATLLEQKLTQYLTAPAVSVIFINFIVNILGDIGHPGMINLQDGKNTIFDALGMSGDMAVTGKREDILVVREKDGKREFGRIDLSSKDVFNSPYYYLKPGDLLYVEPSVNKQLDLDAYTQRKITLIGLTFSVVSFVLLLKNYLKF